MDVCEDGRIYFRDDQIQVITRAVETAEEVVGNDYKLSASQWSQLNYDVKTAIDLTPPEIVDDHFAQIVRYAAKKKDALLDTSIRDFYKICLQDHSIVATLDQHADMALYPFLMYIMCHELIHIVRFRRFLQKFDAPLHEKMAEERRVHEKTHEILSRIGIDGLKPVLGFFADWRCPPDELRVAKKN
jgi:hypothetical protein